MATNKTRVNISLIKELEASLARLAKRDRMPQATRARELIVRAIEIEEGEVWDAVASARDTSSSRFLSHHIAWK